MPVAQTPLSVSEALQRFGGMYGSAWRDGVLLAEVVEVTGAVEVNRIEVPLTGQTKQGYKPGRETREGTLRFQKIDTDVGVGDQADHRDEPGAHAGRTATRASRTSGRSPSRSSTTTRTRSATRSGSWTAASIWRLPLGFSITDDIVDRELPLTWEDETCLFGFNKVIGAGGMPAAQYAGRWGHPRAR